MPNEILAELPLYLAHLHTKIFCIGIYNIFGDDVRQEGSWPPVHCCNSKLDLTINKMHARRCAYVFSVLTKRICMHKTKFLINIFKYCIKNYFKLHEFANCNSANYDV